MIGDNLEYGIGFSNATKLMVEEWNDEGGVKDSKVEIIQFDDKNSLEEAVSVANIIVSDKNSNVVIGHFVSGVSLAATSIYQQNKIIEISPSASHPDYSDVGDYIFRNNTDVVGALIDKVALEPLRKNHAERITSLITTIGISTIITNLLTVLMGSQRRQFSNLFPGGSINIIGMKINYT